MYVFTDKQFAAVERLIADIMVESSKPQQRRHKVYNKAMKMGTVLRSVRRSNDKTGKLF